MSEDINLKRKLIEATESVRKKFKAIKNMQKNESSTLEKMYGPVIAPINILSKSIKAEMERQKPDSHQIKIPMKQDPTEFVEAEKISYGNFHQKVKPHLKETTSTQNIQNLFLEESIEEPTISLPDAFIQDMQENPSRYDTVYGVRRVIGKDKNTLYFGDAEINFVSNKIILARNNEKIGEFKGSLKLYHLLFLIEPPELEDIDNNIPLETLKQYRKMLQLTNAIHLDYNPKKNFRTTRWSKYSKLIKPLFTSSLGSGMKLNKYNKMTLKKILPSRRVDYVHWNTPKELVNRLRLLFSSKTAGNTGHDNEIISIIEELREEGIIY